MAIKIRRIYCLRQQRKIYFLFSCPLRSEKTQRRLFEGMRRSCSIFPCELVGGSGAAYDWNGHGDAPIAGTWAMQGSIGARMAVVKQRRFWLGITGRVISEWKADLGFRFGH
jgi:hypothetical protein